MKIEDIDSNFKPATVGDKEVHYLNAIQAPFSLEGFPWGDPAKGEFFRLPGDLTEADVNHGALWNGHHNASGGAVRFRTDSPFIAIRAALSDSGDMNHMPRAGSAGFDLYCGPMKNAFHVGTAQPNPREEVLERMLYVRDACDTGMNDWLVNFPLYGGLKSIEIGLAPGSALEAPAPHQGGKIVFYGSSITQGGCASRPGNNYCSMLCRAVDAEQVNLGFSGCGRGELAVAKAIASIPGLTAFVMDYDHNAPNAEHLLATHEPFFKAIRAVWPELPVVMLSMCNIWRHKGYAATCRRRDIIKETYDKAVAAGDRHVYFIDGETLFGDRDREACTVDGCHPNDLGFHRMFENVLPTLRKALAEA